MAADRPYQSHLLSFLNRQLQTAKDKTGIIWRTVKLSVSTALTIGVQAIMYPIYAVIKAAELVGKQIQATDGIMGWLRSGQSNPSNKLVHLTSDAPLTSVLTALTQRQIAPTTVGTADALTVALASGLSIQGVASRLSDRRVSLVTSDQQVLDLLSDTQEAQLQHRIRYEIAMYLRWVRSRTLQTSTNSSLPQAAQFKRYSITIPTLWTNPSALGFCSFPNLKDLPTLRDFPNLKELPNLIQAALHYFFGPSRRYYIRGDNQTRLTNEPWFRLETLWGTPPIAALQSPNLENPNADRTTSPITAMPLIGGTPPIATNLLVKPRTISRSSAPIVFNKASNTDSPDQEHY
ncbi:MAG: hypothetical protein LH631_14645, partial [Alkalinema sp. CAN_BIN05]|nr:hypothetical protein [Alkalinema sp. CAN_BIN05]